MYIEIVTYKESQFSFVNSITLPSIVYDEFALTLRDKCIYSYMHVTNLPNYLMIDCSAIL